MYLEIDDVPAAEALDDARHREYDRRERQKDEMDAEQIAELMKDRYGRTDYGSTYKGDLEHVPQRLLIPSVNDPKLYLVRCKVNHDHYHNY